MEGLGFEAAAVGGMGVVGEDVIDGLALLAGVEGLILRVAARAELRVGGLRPKAVTVADELDYGIGVVHPFAEHAAQVARIGGGDVLPLGLVAEGEEGLRDEVARGAQFPADGGDEDDGP